MAPRSASTATQQQEQNAETVLKRNKQDLGAVGNFFGSKENAPVYIAGILAFASLLGMIGVGILASESPEKPDLLKALGGIVLAALTFIGGASSGRRDS